MKALTEKQLRLKVELLQELIEYKDKEFAIFEQNVFNFLEDGCHLKIMACGNAECKHRRQLISGLGGCLCKPKNCLKLRNLKEN